MIAFGTGTRYKRAVRTCRPTRQEGIFNGLRLVDEYRVRCLWFLRPDYYPATLEEQVRILGYIERHGDREAFRRAATLKLSLTPLQRAVCRLLAAGSG